jgi:hypothetical protein
MAVQHGIRIYVPLWRKMASSRGHLGYLLYVFFVPRDGRWQASYPRHQYHAPMIASKHGDGRVKVTLPGHAIAVGDGFVDPCAGKLKWL